MVEQAFAQATRHGIQPEEFDYFKSIFDLEARSYEGYKANETRIDFPAFSRIFKMIGYEPNARQLQEYNQMFEDNNGTINLSDFLTIFSLKQSSQFTDIDVKNAFRLLSKEHGHGNKIKLVRVKEILKEMGMNDQEIDMLTTEMNEMVEMLENRDSNNKVIKEAYIDIDKFVRSPE